MPSSLRSPAEDLCLEVVLCEPYLTGSHRAWAEGLVAHSSHRIRLVSLPGRWWKWRMRGGAVTLAERCAELAEEGCDPDLVMVSSMVDVAALRGLFPVAWRGVPLMAYLHETQLTYPDSPRAEPDLSYAVTNWLSALAADAVAFNSPFHREAFFAELPRLLRRFPDLTHHHRIPEVEARSGLLPVGVELSWVDAAPADRVAPPLVVWNHRWEHDKDPDAFADLVDRAVAAGAELRLALMGARTPSGHPALDRLRERHGGRIAIDEEAPTARYREVLRSADIVVSTAHQEFFGVAVVEAMAAGAAPLLPRRLSYPWLVPDEAAAACLYGADPLPQLLRLLHDPALRSQVAERTVPAARRFAWERVAPIYDEAMRRVAAGENSEFDLRGGPFRV